MTPTPEKNCLSLSISVKPIAKDLFADWQARLNGAIARYPGFLSLEILAPKRSDNIWIFVQRFQQGSHVVQWQTSGEYQDLKNQLIPFLTTGKISDITEKVTAGFESQGGITEVFVTQVSPDKEKEFRDWIAKIHSIEAKFEGFRGCFVQSPIRGQGHNWITLLQFDTTENLEKWLTSEERSAVLEESKPLIASLEGHRMTSPYAGWFGSIVREGEMPAVWKQAMIVLLVLYPVVMLELKFLNPLLTSLNMSVGTFIGNAISVSLVTWPLMPLAIYFLGWWLVPPSKHKRRNTVIGTLAVMFLYLLEVIILWHL